MAPATMKNILFVIFLLSCNVLQALSKCRITTEYTVHVINRLPPGSLLRLHCASGDDDLGYHTTAVDYDFKWRFCENYTGNTLFFCHLYWDEKQVKFDVFKSQWAGRCGSNCNWEARSDGIYFSGKDSPTPADWKKYYDWFSF